VRRAGLAVVLLLAATACRAQEIGRLFFTPAEREALDARRQTAAKPAIAGDVRFSGYLLRRDGRATVWVDGEPQPARHRPGGDRMPPDAAGAALQLRIAGRRDAVRLRVGDSLSSGDAAPRVAVVAGRDSARE
jgi:hypothetical protein